jgi:hypothetical protein
MMAEEINHFIERSKMGDLEVVAQDGDFEGK